MAINPWDSLPLSPPPADQSRGLSSAGSKHKGQQHSQLSVWAGSFKLQIKPDKVSTRIVGVRFQPAEVDVQLAVESSETTFTTFTCSPTRAWVNM